MSTKNNQKKCPTKQSNQSPHFDNGGKPSTKKSMLSASENNKIWDPFAGFRFSLTGRLDTFCQLLQQSRSFAQILDTHRNLCYLILELEFKTHKGIENSKISIGYLWFVADSSPFGPLSREDTLILRDSENMKKNHLISSQSFPSNF